MKRTTLMLDPDLLERATRLLGARTYSAAVNRSLQEVLRQEKVRGFWDLMGAGAWEGDLAEMRGGHGARGRRRVKGRER